jgi:Family of unknown function (DUF6510)
MTEPYLDGNAIGGLLAEVFGVEMTVATEVCGHCGTAGLVAELRVYVRAPGVVVRCPTCDGVLMKLVQSPDRTWLDLSGMRTLQIERPGDPA